MVHSSGPARYPCSNTGRLESDINRLASEVSRKADKYEISTLSSDVGNLAHSIGEVSSVCHGFCSRLEATENAIQRIKDELNMEF